MSVQTREELHRILTLWIEKHAPKELELEGAQGEENGRKVVQHTRDFYGVVSINALNESVKALTEELHWKPKKSQEQRDVEAAQHQFRNRQKEESENRFNHAKAQEQTRPEQQVKDAAKTILADDALQVDAKREMENLIANYETYSGPNRRDMRRTEEGQRKMSAAKVSNGKGGIDWVASLQAARKIYASLP